MQADSDLHLFTDANILMHYQRPDQVDWPGILGRKRIVLVATPLLFRELEEQKVKNPSRKLRDRAKNAIMWLSDLCDSADPVEIRTGVTLAVVRHSPLIDYSKHRLSHHTNDDELIAAVIEYREDYNCEVAVLTADSGLRLKLPAHDITPVRPSDDLLLPDEPDEVEKENEKLRGKLRRYENRMPDIKLTFHDGSLKFALFCMKEQVNEEFPHDAPFMTTEYEYNRYMAKFQKWKKHALVSTPFAIKLANDGKAPATNIEIELSDFPDFVIAADRDEPPKLNLYLDPPLVAFPDERRPSYWDGVSVKFNLSDLVHGRRFESHLVWLRFLDESVIKNFSCSFRITCNEIIAPVIGRLHFCVDEHWKSDSVAQT